MNAFWFLAVGMLLLALVFVLPPLLGRGVKTGVSQRELNLAVYRARLAELEGERDSQRITDSQFEQAKAELMQDMLEDVEPEDEAQAPAPLAGRMAAIATGVLLPLAVLGIYNTTGNWRLIDAPPMQAQTPARAPQQAAGRQTADGESHSMEEMVERLAARMQQEPGNLEGWVMLGRSYFILKRYSEAAQAYSHAMALVDEEDPDLLADYAEALALAHGNTMAGAPAKLLERALAIDPEHAKSLWYGGLAAYEVEDYAVAVERWQKLMVQLPADSDNARQLQQYLSKAQAGLGGDAVVTASEPAAAPAPAATTGSAAPPPPAATVAALQVEVNLDAALADKVGPNDTVFVFARAANGPRMPLAIVRKTVADLPLTVRLDDTMAMTPAMKLSAFPQVVVGARISKSGTAMPQAGDVQGFSQPVKPGATETIQVLINEVNS
jgi:cytochrome c-type biogenesis protein CcmH